MFEGLEAPEVLLNGHHANIQKWRREQSLEITLKRRPELLERAPLDKADRRYLETLRARDGEFNEENPL